MLHELRGEIEGYLAGQQTLRNIESRLVSRLHTILGSGDLLAIEIANEVDADLMEFGDGLLEESELRERWQGYLRRTRTVFLGASGPVHFHTVSTPASVGGMYVITGLPTVVSVPRLGANLQAFTLPENESLGAKHQQRPNRYLGSDLILTEYTK